MNLKRVIAAIILMAGVSFGAVQANAIPLDLSAGYVSFDGWSSMNECLDANYGGYTGNCKSMYDGCGVREIDVYTLQSTMNTLLESVNEGNTLVISLIDPNNDRRITEVLCTLKN